MMVRSPAPWAIKAIDQRRGLTSETESPDHDRRAVSNLGGQAGISLTELTFG
jgi:hypothetical protein